MDREWMFVDRLDPMYKKGVDEFVRHAINQAEDIDEIYCPCIRCGNNVFVNAGDLKNHLLCYGIDKSYTRWIWHGEDALPSMFSDSENDDGESEEDDCDVDCDDRVDDMINDVKQATENPPRMFDKLASDGVKPLYPGCKKFTRLSAVLKLYNLKAKNGWSDKGFTDLLQLLCEMLPEGNELPGRTYEAKKILCPMGVNYERIHACPNDCILYRKEYKDLDECPKCGLSRYKLKKTSEKNRGAASKVLWYLPIIPRFRRLFANARDAEHMVWHAEGRVPDDKIRHPADSTQWKTINFKFPEFASDPRSLRIGLSTDGMNPYGSLSSRWSTWPVLLTIYNLPPWLCMKRKYLMLSLLISGPKQPGNDIDVYLQPLIDDLKLLWDEGVEVYDVYRKETFQLYAMIFCTITDFPAYGNLSGYSVKASKACPICENDTISVRLKHGGKNVYLNHRRFLHRSHPYRRKMKPFNGNQEMRAAPKILSGKQVYEKVKNIENCFGKPYKPPSDENLYKKRSIFWDLPYWKDLSVRHCIDAMHVEKNVCDSIIGTLLNIPGKTKDGVKARADMVLQKIRPELAPQVRGSKTYLPPACLTLSRKEKRSVCECLHGVKVPQGYSSNIKSLVSMKDLKLVGLKSHHCHTLMQQLLPITKLCYFFNAIYSKVIDTDTLTTLQREVVITLCELEMYFPPSFFDIMEHLVIHLVREVKICGPVYLRNQYPFERYMKPLGGYVRNKYRPEGCMIQGYVAEEALSFVDDYLSNVEPIGLPKSRHEDRIQGQGTLGRKVVMISRETLDQAHLYILQHMVDVHPFLKTHKELLKQQNPSKGKRWLAMEHNRSFASWFTKEVDIQLEKNPKAVCENVRWLAHGPLIHVLSYQGYDVNGFCFYTKTQDVKSTVQNSGVALMAKSMSVSSAKDKSPVYDAMPYFGVIEDILELDYVQFRIPVFRCSWVDHRGVRKDEMGFTLVDLKREGYKAEPFIMASQAKQVFYIKDPVDERWSIVLHGKKKFVAHNNMDEVDDELPPFSSGLPLVGSASDVDDFYLRDDHAEGLWVENLPNNTSANGTSQDVTNTLL